jgi:CRP/FNR family transcriptional regulator, anaerobic regulatory protein
MTKPNDHVALRAELLLGRRKLSTRFHDLPPRTLERGELLVTATHSANVIYYLSSGWACQFREFPASIQAIVDVYLPGDVIGLDAVWWPLPSEKVMSLTSVVVEVVIEAKHALLDLMTCQSAALYIAWLLGERQRRSNRHVAAISSLDASGRVATMLLDFLERLSRRELITSSTYNLPLTQIQIGAYLGLTAAHVNRVLRSLRQERIATLENHCLTIFDLERLTRLAEDNSMENLGESLLDEPTTPSGAVRGVVGIEGGVVSGC